MHFSPIPRGFSGLLFDLENKIPGVSRGSPPREANDKCISKQFSSTLSLSKANLTKLKKILNPELSKET